MKKAKKKLKKSKGKRKTKPDPNVENTYWDTISFYCPIKKKMITQKVQVKKYKSLGDILRLSRTAVVTADPLDGIESDDETIYGDTTEADD